MTKNLLWEIESEQERVRWLLVALSGAADYENESVGIYNMVYPRNSTKASQEAALKRLRAITPESILARIKRRLGEFDNNIESYRPKSREMTAGDL